MRGPGKGNTNNPKGKPKGAVNRTTKEARELLEQILFGQIDNIEDALKKLRKDSDPKYIDAITKLFQFVLPRKTDITSDDKGINPINVIIDSDDAKV